MGLLSQEPFPIIALMRQLRVIHAIVLLFSLIEAFISPVPLQGKRSPVKESYSRAALRDDSWLADAPLFALASSVGSDMAEIRRAALGIRG